MSDKAAAEGLIASVALDDGGGGKSGKGSSKKRDPRVRTNKGRKALPREDDDPYRDLVDGYEAPPAAAAAAAASGSLHPDSGPHGTRLYPVHDSQSPYGSASVLPYDPNALPAPPAPMGRAYASPQPAGNLYSSRPPPHPRRFKF